MNNTALTRLRKEYELLCKNQSENFTAYPIKDDLFTWHFTIRGPEGSDFENGLYHGVIKLPTSYPLKPPNIMFLNLNGRFDINVDVCLSVTKYHKEEWQAAWTIRTMLEAIIAFFPIKEDHEAIGAIDYSSESRKKLAIASRKYKCEQCGPISTYLPEKKEIEKVPEKSDSENLNNSEKDEENISDRSSLIKEETNNSDIKNIKKSKNKKIETDRKSHAIEGIIFEDVNEYNDNDEEDKDKEKEIKVKVEKNEVHRSHSDVNHFSDYLKKIRQEQFNADEVPISKKSQDNIKNHDKSKSQDKSKLNDQSNHQDQIKQKEIKKLSVLNEYLNEEIDFYDLQKSIKVHQSTNQDEILKDLLNDKINNILSHEGIKYIKELNMNSNKVNPNEISKNENNSKNFIETVASLSQNIKFEDLLKQKNITLKYFARKTYKECNLKRIRIINLILVVAVLLNFLVYIYFKNYF